jgi:glutathione peroxidase-family protein
LSVKAIEVVCNDGSAVVIADEYDRGDSVVVIVATAERCVKAAHARMLEELLAEANNSEIRDPIE